MLDDIVLSELDTAIEAHHQWLSAQGIDVPGDPARLTALDVLLTIEESKAPNQPAAPELAMGVMVGLKRMCAFRTRAVGLERVRLDLQERLAKRASEASPKRPSRAQAQQAAALDAVHDDKAVRLMETRAKEMRKRVSSFMSSLEDYGEALDERQAKLAKAGYGSVKLLGSARHRVGLIYMQSQMTHLLSELDWFLGDARGTAATDPIGHIGEADTKGWHRLRGECLKELQERGAPTRLRKALHPSNDTDPVREKIRNQQRVRRAKKRVKTNN